MNKKLIRRIIMEELGDPEFEGNYERKRQAQLKTAADAKAQRKAADAEELGKQMSQPVDMSLVSSEVRKMGGNRTRKYHKLPIERITGNYDAAKVVVNNPELMAWVRKNVGPEDRVMGQTSKGGPDPDDVVDGKAFMKAVDYMNATKDDPPYEPPPPGAMDKWESDYFNEDKKIMNKKQILKEIVTIDENGNRQVNRGLLTELVKNIFEASYDPGNRDSPYFTPQYVERCVDTGFVESKNIMSLRTEHAGWTKFLNESGIGCEVKQGGEEAAGMEEAHQPWRGKRTMADLDKDAKTRETDFLKKGSEPQQGDDVSVVSGGLAGAYGEVMELTTTTEGEPGVVIYLHKDANKRLAGAKGDEVIAKISDVEVDKGIQAENIEDESGWGEIHGNAADYAPSKKEALDALSELDKVIDQFFAQGDEQDANDLQKIRGMFTQELQKGAAPGRFSQELKDTVSRLDTIVRDAVPENVFYAISPEVLEESYDDDYMDDLEEEFPWLSKSVKAKEIPAEVAAQLAKEYGNEELENGAPVVDASEPVQEAEEGGDKEQQIKKIVDDKQAAKVDGVTLDLYSASAIVKVLDAINDQNKERFLSMPVDKMAQIAFKMMKEEKTHES